MSPNQPEDPMNASSLQRCYVQYVPLVLAEVPSKLRWASRPGG
jgi:hypothetical protein